MAYLSVSTGKTANDSVQDIIANLAPEASRYFILLAIIQQLWSP